MLTQDKKEEEVMWAKIGEDFAEGLLGRKEAVTVRRADGTPRGLNVRAEVALWQDHHHLLLIMNTSLSFMTSSSLTAHPQSPEPTRSHPPSTNDLGWGLWGPVHLIEHPQPPSGSRNR